MESNSCCVFESNVLSAVLPPLLLSEFVLGFLGNGLALWIFCFYLKTWKNSTVFLFNLALADFFLNMFLPFRAYYYWKGKDWTFGLVFCRLSLFMLGVNRCGSIFFLTAIAVDRYMRVVHPHHPLNFVPVSTAVYIACGLWALTVSLTAHILSSAQCIAYRNSVHCEYFHVCQSQGSWNMAVFMITFYIPLAIILVCSISIIICLKNRGMNKNAKIKKALRFIAVVVVMFFICFFPSNFTQLLLWAKTHGPHMGACDDLKELDSAFFVTISLTYLNSMLDPLVYYFSSPTFKRICTRVVRCAWRQEQEENPHRCVGPGQGSAFRSLSQVR